MILLRLGLLALKCLMLNKNNISFQISIYSFGMEISRFISRISPQQKQAAVGDLQKQGLSRRTSCTLVKVECRSFLKYKINCKQLYRFNNIGNR